MSGIDHFYLNGYLWHVERVPDDHEMLVDRFGVKRVATTDPVTRCVYLSESLDGDFLNTVFVHELGHCVIFSYGLLDDLHHMVHHKYWADAEEYLCNFVADYGLAMFVIASDILGDEALLSIKRHLSN